MAECGGQSAEKLVRDVMTRSVITCSRDDDINTIMATMNTKKIRHIPVVKEDRLVSMLSIRDFDDAYQRIQALARMDEVTELANRQHFMEILDNEFNRFRMFRTPLSVAAIEIDSFEEIRANSGNAAGDKVLSALAQLLQRESRAFDGIGRTGGHQFGVVLPSTDERRALRACNRILEHIRALRMSDDGDQATFTVSVGLTFANDQTRNAESLFEEAGRLTDAARKLGGDLVAADNPQAEAVASGMTVPETDVPARIA